MGFTQEEVASIAKFLNSENQRGIFVLDELTVVGTFWEKFKKHLKEENFDFDLETLDLLVKILEVCLNRKGNDKEVLRTTLALLDKATLLCDALKPSGETQSSIEEVKE